MEEGNISVGSLPIGKVRLDPAEVRGEGGEHDPRLVIPIKIDLYQQPLEHQIFVVRLSASLFLEQDVSQRNQFASKISYDLFHNMLLASTHLGVNNRTLDLYFGLTQAQLKELENKRHEPGKYLYVRLEPVIAWNKHTGNLDNRPYGGDSTLEEGRWSRLAGSFSDWAFFWLPTIDTLRLDLAKMNWVTQIFPGLGYDSFRLIEVKLPTSDILIPEGALEHFKEAMQDYDRGSHIECIMKFRLAHEAIEKHLNVQSHELGKVVTKALGWVPGSEQEKFLDGAWKALYVVTNASHHTPSVKSLLPADAHMVLISTAALLEYLAQLV